MDSYNYSAINLARKCPTLFKNVYIEKREDDSHLSGDMAFGRAIHLACNHMLLGEDGLAVYVAYWEKYKDQQMNYTRYKWQELFDIGFLQLKKFKDRFVSRFELVQSDTRLYGTYKDLKIEGTPDFIGKYQGIDVVLDFKTSRARYQASTVSVSDQLYLYRYLAKQNLNFDAQELIYIVFVKNHNPEVQTVRKVWNPISEDILLGEYYRTAQLLNQAQESGTWPKNISSCLIGANICKFFNECHPSPLNRSIDELNQPTIIKRKGLYD